MATNRRLMISKLTFYTFITYHLATTSLPCGNHKQGYSPVFLRVRFPLSAVKSLRASACVLMLFLHVI